MEEIKNYEKVIFSGLFKSDEGVSSRRNEFISAFTTNDVFSNEHYVFYSLIKNFPKIVFDKEFMLLFLNTNKGKFSKETCITISDFSFGDNDSYVEFTNSCIALFEEYTKTQVTESDMLLSIEKFKIDYLARKSLEILEESAIILTEGKQVKGKSLNGFNDMSTNVKYKLSNLSNIANKSKRKGFITYENDINEEEEAVKLISTFGIDELDKHINIYEGDMISLLAPAKGGKSRFATFILHNAVVKHGCSIVMWSIENGYKGWEYLIRARHFNYLYNSKVTDIAQKRFVDADQIRRGLLTGELKDLEEASWLDLRKNSKYGKIVNIDEDFDNGTFLEILENAVSVYGAKLICVDYLQLIADSNTRGSSKNERIGDAYMKCLQFIKSKKIAGIFPAQLKQSFVSDLGKTKGDDLVNKEMRDSAGESYEVIKTPDVNLALYATVEDIKNGEMKILSIPSRNSQPFNPIDVFAELGSCTFTGVNNNS